MLQHAEVMLHCERLFLGTLKDDVAFDQNVGGRSDSRVSGTINLQGEIRTLTSSIGTHPNRVVHEFSATLRVFEGVKAGGAVKQGGRKVPAVKNHCCTSVNRKWVFFLCLCNLVSSAFWSRHGDDNDFLISLFQRHLK